MSNLKVEVTRIEEVLPHPNADRLSIVKCFGWYVVTGKDTYKVGDLVVYIPVDSVLDQKFIEYFFEGSKIKPDSPIKHRVRSIKIRGYMSQGIILDLRDGGVLSLYPELKRVREEDVAKILNVTKYEPPEFSLPVNLGPNRKKVFNKKHPEFKEYTDISNFKFYRRCFVPGEEVVITLKVHGTNHRCAVLESVKDTWWKRVLAFFNLYPKLEYCVGSHKVQVNRNRSYKGFYGHDVYTKTVQKYGLLSRLEPGMELFGEAYGSGIQGAGFEYGCVPGEVRYVAFDIIKNGKYLDYDEFVKYCDDNGIPRVPEVYRGPFSEGVVDQHRDAKDHHLDENVPCREGVVVKPIKERNTHACGRLILKAIGDKYYLIRNSTDNH